VLDLDALRERAEGAGREAPEHLGQRVDWEAMRAIQVLLAVAVVACGSSDPAAPPATRDAKAKAPAPARRVDLGVTMERLGCGATAPVAIACEAGADGKVVRVELTTATADGDAAGAMRQAVTTLLDVVAPKMSSTDHNIALHSLLSSAKAETVIDGLVYRFEKATGLRYWVEPSPGAVDGLDGAR
jgi:hypothetical protein